MDEKQKRKIKLEQLMNIQKLKHKDDYSSLFTECIQALDHETIVFSEQETSEIYDSFQLQYPFSIYGRIDWEKVEHSTTTLDELIKIAQDRQLEECYVLWSHGNDPAIKSTVLDVLNNFYEVTSVSPDVWLFKENEYVIELFHDSLYRIGNYMKSP